MSTRKTILITGASSGIGSETARHLAAGNDIVVHFNSSEADANSVADEVDQRGGLPLVVQADLSTEAGCRKLADAVAGNFAKLDVLVNNAGDLIRRHSVREIEWAFVEDIFARNVFGAIALSHLCIPLLEKGTQACVVNVTSVAVRTGAPSATIYGASKAALDSFTRSLACELAPAIRVNSVAPGVIATRLHERFTEPEQLERFREATPLKRFGHPRNIAMAIGHLIENDYITGESIDINGGISMR